MVAILLAGLGRLGGNAFIAKRLIAALASHGPGRTALRTAATRWQAQATGASTTGEAALQWAVSRLWQQGAGSPRPLQSHRLCCATQQSPDIVSAAERTVTLSC